MQALLQRIIYAPVSLLQLLQGHIRAILNPLPSLFETASENPVLETRLAAMSQLLAYYKQKENPEAAYYVGLLSNDERFYPEFFHRLRAIFAFQFGTRHGYPGCSTQLVVAKLLYGYQIESLISLEKALFQDLRTNNPHDLDAITQAGMFLVESSDPVAQQLGLSCLQKAAAFNYPLACHWVGRALLNGEVIAEDYPQGLALLRQAATAGVPEAWQDLAITLATTQPESQEPEEIIAKLLQMRSPAYIQAACMAGLGLVQVGKSVKSDLLMKLAEADANTCLELVYYRVNGGGKSCPQFDHKLQTAAFYHAQANRVHGHIALAVCQQIGLGTRLDLETAYFSMATAYSLCQCQELQKCIAIPLAVLAFHHWQQHHDANAHALCLKLAQLNDHHPEAQAILHLLEHEGAKHCLPLLVLANSEKSSLALQHLAGIYHKRGDTKAAIRMAYKWALNFRDWRAYDLLACLFLVQDPDRARRYTALSQRFRQSCL